MKFDEAGWLSEAPFISLGNTHGMPISEIGIYFNFTYSHYHFYIWLLYILKWMRNIISQTEIYYWDHSVNHKEKKNNTDEWKAVLAPPPPGSVREIERGIPPARCLILRTGTGRGSEERGSGGKLWACRVLSLPVPPCRSALRARVSLWCGMRLSVNVAVLLKVAPLQHLDVMLVNFECGAESDRQTCQHVAALHQQEGLPVDFLQTNRGERVEVCGVSQLSLFISFIFYCMLLDECNIHNIYSIINCFYLMLFLTLEPFIGDVRYKPTVLLT